MTAIPAITAFKAYDLRGRIPTEINPDIAYRVARGYAEFLKPKRVCVGRDIRLSSAELAASVIRGLADSGVDVVDIGLCGTEGVYYATAALGLDGGIMVTASHNPPDYNGMKFVREGSRPISGDTGLKDVRRFAEAGEFATPAKKGAVTAVDTMPKYIEHLLTYIDRSKLKKLKIVCNAGNGGAGLIVDQLEAFLPFEFVKVYHEPDGTFPHGVPNPMLEQNHAVVRDAVLREKADMGIAWDGDYDRCFFFDEKGAFIEGYYIVGLLAAVFLKREPGARIVHDPRLTWNTIDYVKSLGGVPVMCKSGHAFIKDVMRKVDAAYGGEMSAHHYFREFAYCDSGMISWLVVAQVLSEAGKPFSTLVEERVRLFPSSGEINRRVPDVPGAIAAVQARYQPESVAIDFTDGLSLEFANWRFNLRGSNTEPLLRLNVESRHDIPLMQAKTKELLEFLATLGAVAADH
jgi:phosphomannomutase